MREREREREREFLFLGKSRRFVEGVMYYESFSSPLRFSAALVLLLLLLVRVPGRMVPLCSGAYRGVRFVTGGAEAQNGSDDWHRGTGGVKEAEEE